MPRVCSLTLPFIPQKDTPFGQEEAGTLEMTVRLLSIIRLLAGFVAMIMVVGILRADVSVSEAFKNAPWAFYSAAISGIVFGILQAYEFLKKMFNSKKASFTELKRGIIDRETLKLAEQPFEVAEQFEG